MTDFEDLKKLQDEFEYWEQENFGEQPPEWRLMGAVEELGELHHSELKQMQGIRLEDDDVGPEATRDAVGDTVIYLINFCNVKGIDFSECLKDASEEVLDREWESNVNNDRTHD